MRMYHNNIGARILGILDAIISIIAIGVLLVVIVIVRILNWIWGNNG